MVPGVLASPPRCEEHPGMDLSRCLPLALAAALLSCDDSRLESQRDPPDAGGPRCGDGRVNAGEDCDGSDLAGSSCTSLGFDTGSLTCDDQCRFITFNCVKFCGNGQLDPGEECDGQLGPLSCGEWGYKTCSDACRV